MKCQSSLLGDAVSDRPLKFRAQWKHAAKDFPERRQVVAGDPLAKADQLRIEHRRRIKHADKSFGTNGWLAVMQSGDNAGQALLAKRHEHTPAYDRLQLDGNSIGEDGINWDRKGNVAEFRH